MILRRETFPGLLAVIRLEQNYPPRRRIFLGGCVRVIDER